MTTLIQEFINDYPNLWSVSPADRDRVIQMMTLIENCVIHKHTAGGFITAIVQEDFIRAAFNADETNFRRIGIYICFRDFLKNYQK